MKYSISTFLAFVICLAGYFTFSHLNLLTEPILINCLYVSVALGVFNCLGLLFLVFKAKSSNAKSIKTQISVSMLFTVLFSVLFVFFFLKEAEEHQTIVYLFTLLGNFLLFKIALIYAMMKID